MGSATVASITAALRILHKLEWDFQIPKDVNTDTWYIAMSNHQSWADIFILLAAGHKKIPLLKFFMKKELQWIPIIYLVHKTVDMPFLNRHSKAQIQANPELKKLILKMQKKPQKDSLEILLQHLALLKELDLISRSMLHRNLHTPIY
jgi:1-acyl-sn-glycerol-3-phosphate acyltransferase